MSKFNWEEQETRLRAAFEKASQNFEEAAQIAFECIGQDDGFGGEVAKEDILGIAREYGLPVNKLSNRINELLGLEAPERKVKTTVGQLEAMTKRLKSIQKNLPSNMTAKEVEQLQGALLTLNNAYGLLWWSVDHYQFSKKAKTA